MYMIHPYGIQHGVIRISDKAFIPVDLKNRDWQEFLQWRAQGNEPVPYDETQL